MSQAATLAGAVPSHGNMGCLPQVRIVEVSSGKRRRAESGRFDRAVAPFCVEGVANSPTADSGVTAHHRETGPSCLLRGDDGLHRSPPATTAEAVVGETAFCEGRLSRLELYASEGCPYSS
jgi:hypothetical protein